MKYKYYVVYCWNSPLVGLGSCEIITDTEMNTIEGINKVRDYVSKEYCEGNTAIILNYKELKN